MISKGLSNRDPECMLELRRRNSGALKHYEHFLLAKFAVWLEIMAHFAARESKREEPKCGEFIDTPLIVEPARWPECCIYRVPYIIRKINEDAFTPKLVSIGPFHHDLQELEGVRKQKLMYFKEFCSRTGKSQKDLASIVERRNEKILHYYSEKTTFELNDCRFSAKILLDATFIIELFLRNFDREKYEKGDYILSNAWIESHIKQDLILLENQLPFRFLRKFYKSAYDREEGTPFLELACQFFFPGKHRIPMDKDKEVKHFTDLHRMFYCPTNPKAHPQKRTEHLRYTATKLDQAGLEFRVLVETDLSNRSLLDIEFSKDKFLERYPCFNLSWLFSCLPCLIRSFPCFKSMECVLKVPQLVIDEHTEAIFRNLMALEQCHYPLNTYICNYVLLMNILINAEQDVDLLVEKNAIVNYIGSNAKVATLFSELCNPISESNSCYYDLSCTINDYYDNRWNRMRASIKRTFRDYGKCIATVAALLTLVGLFIPFLKK